MSGSVVCWTYHFNHNVPKVESRQSMRNPASKEMISDSVELWDTDVCFLHIQLIGTNVRLPKIHKTLPEVDFESSRPPAKSESWNKPSRQCWAVLPTWQLCRNSFVWWMYEINLANRLSHAWVHFVTALASLLTDHRMSGLPSRFSYKHLITVCEQTCDNSPSDSSSSCLNWWSSRQRLATLYNCATVLFARSQYRPAHFPACPSMS